MPIRESERKRYPKDWKAIAARIRNRAEERCECRGECGIPHETKVGGRRCVEINRSKAVFFRGPVILTVAHLDHTPENCSDENLKAMCQRCHLRYDRHHHAANARATRDAKNPQLRLGLEETTK